MEMLIPDLIEISLPAESPHPAAGRVDQICIADQTAWIHRRYDSHLVSLQTGEICYRSDHPPLMKYEDKHFGVPLESGVWHAPDFACYVFLREARSGNAQLSCFDWQTGKIRWETEVAVPNPISTMRMNDSVELPDVFFAIGTTHPTLCVLTKQNNDTRLYVNQVSVDDGRRIWSQEIEQARIGILTKPRFSGLFKTDNTVGRIDLKTGACKHLPEQPGVISQPIIVGDHICFSTYEGTSAHLYAADADLQNRTQLIQFKERQIHETEVYDVAALPLLRVNQGKLILCRHEGDPLFIKVRPFVYGIAAATQHIVYVMTDGQGGRLQAFDMSDGGELLNIKPKMGGFGRHTVDDNLIVASVATSRDWSKRALHIIDMQNLNHQLRPVNGHMLGAKNGFAIVQSSTNLNELECVGLAE